MKNEERLLPMVPGATYRLQFNRLFTFRDAGEIVPYLHEIGITDVYGSPYFMAKKGSLHGYDIVDHSALNPEIGTDEDFRNFIRELHKYGMGQIMDIVPNHMCIESPKNAWWMDVLENGPSSPYADFFDINWEPSKRELRNKVLIPVLGDQYGKVLENQELTLVFSEGAFFLEYYEHRFPILPKSYIFVLEHRLSSLDERLSQDDLHFTELLSIITALNHLPAYTEISAEKITERHREKEIIKRRLAELYSGSNEIRAFIDENVSIFNGVHGEPGSFDLIDELLDMQVYRLSHWRVATEEINYRRFFDINGLGAVRTENPEVFQETHEMVMRLIREGSVSGLRIDHPDGLYDPSEYFRKLQRSCYLNQRLGVLENKRDEVPTVPETQARVDDILRSYDEALASDPLMKPFYIVGEKILIRGERMPEEWPIFSTTGYVFMNLVNGIFVETRNAKMFDRIYERFTGMKMHFPDVVYEKKNLIMHVAMSSEINMLGHHLNRISEKDRHTRDFTLNSLTNVIAEVIAFFPVYRTYTNSYAVSDRDRQYIEAAVSKAKRKNPAISESIFDFLKDVLLLRFPEDFGGPDKEEWLDFVMRFQQITGPVMAKGLEDTTFYVYNRLVSLNEVGGMPDRFGTPLETFHGQNIERSKFWPCAMITASTHDAKRSEDVRARINVLSEIPDEWKRRVLLWRKLNAKKKPVLDGQQVPDPNEEYLFYQTLIGAWPIGPLDGAAYENFNQRIRDYMLKAIREAKVNTSWINPNAGYEEAVAEFIGKVMNNVPENKFLKDIEAFQRKVLHYGLCNSLSQTLLKITSPGVPDFYQGTEIWDFSLVDPDNRRPVDYGMRIKMFRELEQQEREIGPLRLSKELTVEKKDGRIKLYLVSKALNFRKAHRDLFEKGEYIPLEGGGSGMDHLCAFVRRFNNQKILVAVPRFVTTLTDPDTPPLGPAVWGDTFVTVPFSRSGSLYRNVFTGEAVEVRTQAGANAIDASGLFLNFPVALLEWMPSREDREQ